MEQPKQRPILFNEEMVRSLDAGWKTQTRRTTGLDTFNWQPDEWVFKSILVHPKEGVHVFFSAKDGDDSTYSAKFPYGKIGDVLYVRETWGMMTADDINFEFPVYKAQEDACGQVPNLDEKNTLVTYKDGWNPSIHMPKMIARNWQKITGIRVERLQDIKPEDAVAEGIKRLPPWPEVPDKPRYKDYFTPALSNYYFAKDEPAVFDPIFSFFTLWCSINGDDAVRKNPWVWVIEFEKIENPNAL